MAKTPAVTISGSKRPAAGVAAASLPEAPSIGNMLGTIALAIGVGVLGYYALDGHSHTCEACGHRWRHLGVLNLGDPVAHSCARCGTVQWWKDGVPHVFREALRSHDITYRDLSGTLSAGGHFHTAPAGRNGGVVRGIASSGDPASATISGV